MENINDKLIQKIQKLLALASSSNENEAETAARMAQELLVKHNLDLQQVQKTDFDYTEQTASEEPYVRWHQPYIHRILQAYFFVKVIYFNKPVGMTIDGRIKNKKEIRFFGTKTNVQIAMYINDFLSRTFQELWLKYKKETGCSEKSRKSYYRGLQAGLSMKIELTREKVIKERGLILIDDPKLKERTENLHNYTNSHQPIRNIVAEADGIKHGEKIQISKTITSESSSSIKLLRGKNVNKNK